MGKRVLEVEVVLLKDASTYKANNDDRERTRQ